MINESIPDIISYLQLNYGQVTEHELNDKENLLKATVYDRTLPVNLVFNTIKTFQDLCILLVSIAYLIFYKSRAFTCFIMASVRHMIHYAIMTSSGI